MQKKKAYNVIWNIVSKNKYLQKICLETKVKMIKKGKLERDVPLF